MKLNKFEEGSENPDPYVGIHKFKIISIVSGYSEGSQAPYIELGLHREHVNFIIRARVIFGSKIPQHMYAVEFFNSIGMDFPEGQEFDENILLGKSGLAEFCYIKKINKPRPVLAVSRYIQAPKNAE